MIKRLIVCCALIITVTSCKKESKDMAPAVPSMKGWVTQNIPGAKINSQSVAGNDVFIITTVTAQADRYTSESAIANISVKDTPAGRFYSYAVTGQAGYDQITLNFAKLRETAVNGYVTISKLTSTGTAVPLERKTALAEGGSALEPDQLYKTWWNHNVVGAKGITGFDELSWQSVGVDQAKSGLDIPDGQPDGLMWSKANQGVNTQKQVYLNAKKPGVQSFLTPFIELKQALYTLDAGAVEDAVSGVGLRWKVTAPDFPGNNIFGYSGDALKWLKSSAITSKENGHWRIDVTYKYALYGWDQDLYPKAELSE
jgi:hypothetical protein